MDITDIMRKCNMAVRCFNLASLSRVLRGWMVIGSGSRSV